jgi:hypothetical protein
MGAAAAGSDAASTTTAAAAACGKCCGAHERRDSETVPLAHAYVTIGQHAWNVSMLDCHSIKSKRDANATVMGHTFCKT